MINPALIRGGGGGESPAVFVYVLLLQLDKERSLPQPGKRTLELTYVYTEHLYEIVVFRCFYFFLEGA